MVGSSRHLPELSSSSEMSRKNLTASTLHAMAVEIKQIERVTVMSLSKVRRGHCTRVDFRSARAQDTRGIPGKRKEADSRQLFSVDSRTSFFPHWMVRQNVGLSWPSSCALSPSPLPLACEKILDVSMPPGSGGVMCGQPHRSTGICGLEQGVSRGW